LAFRWLKKGEMNPALYCEKMTLWQELSHCYNTANHHSEACRKEKILSILFAPHLRT